MTGVFEGFFAIATLISVGYVLARLGVLDANTQRVLSHVAFWLASPALLLTVMARTPPSEALGAQFWACLVTVTVTVTAYLVIARWRWRPGLGESVIGSLAASYVNAGNLGIPVAQYVLGDVKAVAPLLLLQLMVLTPVAMALLDASRRGEKPRPWVSARAVVSNPITVCSVIGLLISVTRVQVPRALMDPIALVGGMAVPAMLIAFGISLHTGPKPGRGGSLDQILTIVTLKLVLQPVTAFLVARYLFGMQGHALFTALVLAALPTAQNIFVYASQYQRGVILARDAIFISTIMSAPTIVLITVVFHA